MLNTSSDPDTDAMAHTPQEHDSSEEEAPIEQYVGISSGGEVESSGVTQSESTSLKQDTPLRQRAEGSEDEYREPQCLICLSDVALNPVATACGHVFCSQCLSAWLEMHGDCPVCKSAVDRTKVINLFGLGQRDESQPEFSRFEPDTRDGGDAQGGEHIFAGFRRVGFGFGPFMFNLAQLNGLPGPERRQLTPEQRRRAMRKQLLMLFIVVLLFCLSVFLNSFGSTIILL